MGNTTIFDELFRDLLQDKEKRFSVIVVDTSPLFPGREILQRLSTYGVPCKYTLISGVTALIHQATKVFIDACYVLGNGGVVAPTGASMLAYMANQYRVPVIVFSETYKFTQRVNLDQIKNNQTLEATQVVRNPLLDCSKREQDALMQKRNLKLAYLKYDFTPMDCVSMIMCEIGRVSPVSVPVIVAEFNEEKKAETF